MSKWGGGGCDMSRWMEEIIVWTGKADVGVAQVEHKLDWGWC